MGKRSRFEIMADILSSAKDGGNKTRIVYEAYLNFRQAEEYLNYLMEEDLITTYSERNRTIYYTTEKGVKMLEWFNDLIELNPAIK